MPEPAPVTTTDTATSVTQDELIFEGDNICAEVNAADPASEGIRFGPDTANIPRDFVQQPPLVPHTMDEYKVTKEFNKCLDCHSWARAKEMKATKISSNVSPNRYFCAQCHVPQSDAKPLVGNTFTPGKGLK